MSKHRLKRTSVRRFLHRLNWAMGIIAGVGVLLLVFLTAVEVFKRYFLNMPSEWSLEVSQYLLIFCAFLGMSYAMQVGAHVSVDVIYRRYSEYRKRIADLVAAFASLSFWTILTWKALQQSLLYLERNMRSETLLAVPLFYPMMLIVIGGLAACFQSLLMGYDAWASLMSGDWERPTGGGREAPVHHRGAR